MSEPPSSCPWIPELRLRIPWTSAGIRANGVGYRVFRATTRTVLPSESTRGALRPECVAADWFGCALVLLRSYSTTLRRRQQLRTSGYCPRGALPAGKARHGAETRPMTLRRRQQLRASGYCPRGALPNGTARHGVETQPMIAAYGLTRGAGFCPRRWRGAVRPDNEGASCARVCCALL